MVDEGPTTAATLQAKFVGDDSQVMRTIDRVKAAALELGADDVTVSIDAKGADRAVADMGRVQAAAGALGVADDRLTVSQNRLNDANGRGLQRWRMIAAAVVLLLPLLGPLVGYSAAVAGGMTAMGAAGVAAILGIRNEMQRGTEVGNTYSAGLQILKGDLNELGHTAAVAMLDSYERVIGLIQARMPQLNQDTRLFSGILGATGTLVANGLLTAFQALLPLFVTGAVYIERIGAGFLSWTQGGGIETFASYALNVLPQVAATLQQIAKLALDVAEAAAPWGGVMLTAIRDIAAVLDMFPVPVLGAIASGAIAGYGAFKLWSGLTGGIERVRDAMRAVNDVIQQNIPMTQAALAKSATFTAFLSEEAGVAEAVAIGEEEAATAATGLGAAMDFASGPLGIVLAAMGALAAIITVAVSTTNDQTQATKDYTAAVQQDNGVIGENVRLQAAKNLQEEGAFKTAQKLGVSTDTLVKAALGEGAAHKQVTEAIQKKTTALDQQIEAQARGQRIIPPHVQALGAERDALNATASAVDSNSGAIKTAIKAYNDLQKALGGTTITTKEQLQEQQDLASGYGASLSAYEDAKREQKQTADQLKATTLQMQLQGDAAGLLKQALDVLNGKTLDVATAQTGMAAANNGVIDSFKQNKVVVDGTSEAAVANQQAIQGAVQASEQYAAAVGKQTGSSEQARQALIDSKQQLEDNLQSQGLLTQSVKDYIDQIFQIPASVPPTKVDIDDAEAKKKLADWQAFIARAIPKDVRLQVHLDTSNNASGGTIGRAGGGTVHGPGSSTSDSVPAWLSVGEEVIRASSAVQVRPLLKAINRDPAAAVSGVMAMGAAAAGKVENHYHLHADGYAKEHLFAEFQRRIAANANTGRA